MEATDFELVQSCLAGRQECFEELVARYKKLVYNIVYNFINDREEVSDISQEVFIRIYRSLDRYNPEYKFSTWAAKISTNLCLDILRKKKLDCKPLEDYEGMASSSDTPESRCINRERSEQIKKAITDLPEKYRVPIILFHQNGLSYEEMTTVLNEPMTIIKNRLFRARHMLKDKLMNDRKEEAL